MCTKDELPLRLKTDEASSCYDPYETEYINLLIYFKFVLESYVVECSMVSFIQVPSSDEKSS